MYVKMAKGKIDNEKVNDRSTFNVQRYNAIDVNDVINAPMQLDRIKKIDKIDR